MDSPVTLEALRNALREGFQSDSSALPALREASANAPDNLQQRARLLGALSRHDRSDVSTESLDQVLWWLEHHTLKFAALDGALHMFTHARAPVYQRVGHALEAALATHGDDVDVVLAAAQVFQHHEPERALALLERAHGAAVEDPRPAEKSGQIWRLRSMRGRAFGSPDRSSSAESLRWFEKALEREPDSNRRGPILEYACDVALEAAQAEAARTFANELLKIAASDPASWNTGNALYAGHVTLGRLALQENDLEGAKRHLLQAGKTPGSPQLNSFGPELQLAHDLLQRGERATVTEFLRAIAAFWEHGRTRTELWCFQIERGETPKLSRFPVR